ncbi:MAG: transglycosylase SLT domain-containing protein [Pyrinomonadaceae bacterium]
MRLVFVAAFTFAFQIALIAQASDIALRGVTEDDRASRDSAGKLVLLPASEHLARGKVYFDNRLFPQSREHFYKIIENYQADPALSGALFMTGRSYYWERDYSRAIPYLDRVSREFPATKDGREGLSFKGACHVRLGKNSEAAKIYEQYTVMYPTGERIDGAYLNTIDALREAGKYDEADAWVDKARIRFEGMPTEINALQGRLRMQIHRGLWTAAAMTADTMITVGNFSGSMTTSDEAKFLKGTALEKAGRRADAAAVFASIPRVLTSYYGGLAADRLMVGGNRVKATGSVSLKDFPAVFTEDVLRESRKRKIDPRFVLAIMKQESSFRPAVKSPSAARGLLQLVYDTALKYNKKAGYSAFVADDLYKPSVNIAIGCEYIADLNKQFNGLYEAIAASYNGGEDNAARWLNRSKPKEPGIFAAEIGFAETKHYVFKVMTNYRIYQELYDENLVRK